MPATSNDESQGTPATAQTASGPGGKRLWMGISVGFALLWCVTMLAWWRSRQRTPRPLDAAKPQPRAPVGAAQARAQFREACRRNDAHAARHCLLAWVAAAWPDEPIPGLDALAKRLGDAAVTPKLAELDRACFAGADWDGAGLLQVLTDLPPRRARSGGGPGDGLAPLYP